MYEEKIEVEDMEAVREHMLARLEQMRRSGVELFVDGQEALPGAAVCCRLGLPLMLTAAVLPSMTE